VTLKGRAELLCREWVSACSNLKGHSFILHKVVPCVMPTDSAWDFGSRDCWSITSTFTGFRQRFRVSLGRDVRVIKEQRQARLGSLRMGFTGAVPRVCILLSI